MNISLTFRRKDGYNTNMYKMAENDYTLLEQMADEALCALAASGNRLAEDILVERYTRIVRSCARPYFLVGGDSEQVVFSLLNALESFLVLLNL